MANQPDEHKDANTPPVFNDEQTRKRIDEHLSNPDDEITEDDIRNISTDPNPRYRVDQDAREHEENTPDEENSERPKGDDDPGNIQTPWDVLGT